ncbi:MAG: hypothetical protein U0414_15835 [Polyangiaceae bacterium]
MATAAAGASDPRETGVHPRSSALLRELSICVIDMNNGHVNQAMRCFRGIVASFFERVARANPGLRTRVVEVSPRDTQARIPRDCDIYIGSGGPGSPYDGDHERWFADFSSFCDEIAVAGRSNDGDEKSLFAVCYTFEMLVRHFKVADVSMRDSRKFGVMPIYTTPYGQRHDLLHAFHDRLFAFEHRNWEAVNLDEARLRELGGGVLAQESRDGHSKGRALLGVDFGGGIEGVQFHPEADRAGVMSWVARPEQAEAFRETYGEFTYQAMLRTLDDPNRLARTFALVIPGYLTRRFNRLASHRGYTPVEPPSTEDVLAAFSGDQGGATRAAAREGAAAPKVAVNL